MYSIVGASVPIEADVAEPALFAASHETGILLHPRWCDIH
jgi:hypothetical protein